MPNFDPILTSYAHLITDINFVISTILFPVIFYLILTNSKQMSKYKFYLLNNILWCQGFEIILFIGRPTLLFPSFCVLADPLFPISNQILPYLFYLGVFFIVNQAFSIVLSLFYRHSQVSGIFIIVIKFVYLKYFRRFQAG